MMLSSANRQEDAIRCRDLGVASYLTKPVRQSILLDAIIAALGTASAPGDHDARKTPATAPATGRRALRLLLADDSAVNQRLAVSLLKKWGHCVVVADNGREAVAAMDRGPFDVVLMDVQMPEMDGFEATAAIRAREATTGAHTPIVAMTAHALKGDRERCLEAGMDAYLSKPLRPQELLELLDGLAPATVEDGAPADEPKSPPPAAFDMAAALERVNGDLELLKELVGLFRDDCPPRMAEIRRAIDRRDGPSLASAAHYLKGSAGNLGSRPAFEAAGRLERDGRDRNWDRAEQDWAALEDAIGRLEPAFDALLGTGATPPSDGVMVIDREASLADGVSTSPGDLDSQPARSDP